MLLKVWLHVEKCEAVANGYRAHFRPCFRRGAVFCLVGGRVGCSWAKNHDRGNPGPQKFEAVATVKRGHSFRPSLCRGAVFCLVGDRVGCSWAENVAKKVGSDGDRVVDVGDEVGQVTMVLRSVRMERCRCLLRRPLRADSDEEA